MPSAGETSFFYSLYVYKHVLDGFYTSREAFIDIRLNYCLRPWYNPPKQPGVYPQDLARVRVSVVRIRSRGGKEK